MKCTNCGYENATGAKYCSQCNQVLSGAPASTSSSAAPQMPSAPSSPQYANTGSPTQSTTPAYQSTSSPVRSSPQYNYSQPYYYPQFPIKEKQPFTITDAYIIIGFVLALVGIFTYSFILLPASILFSIVGFVKRTNVRTLGLSIAGIVVGVVACLIKIGSVLNDLGVIPDWLSAGIF